MGLYYLTQDSTGKYLHGVDDKGSIVYTDELSEAALLTMSQAQRLLHSHTPYSITEEEVAEIARRRVETRPLEELAKAEKKVGQPSIWNRFIIWIKETLCS